MADVTTWDGAFEHIRIASNEAISQVPLSYESGSALGLAFQFLALVIAVCWILSVLTGNYSHVDRLWSITPFVYVVHFAYKAYLEDNQFQPRLVLMSILSVLWGLRLTYNFGRKGGYRLSEEDYRWGVLREKMHWIFYQIFNIVFITIFQLVLLFLIASPAYIAYTNRYDSWDLNAVDAVSAALFLAFLLLETVADQQQWTYYTRKYELINNKEKLTGDYKIGFNRSGLFKYSRHPNFFAELSIWYVFYGFSVAASNVAINPSIVGCLLLTSVFSGSVPFTEYISVSKYPAYRDYQKQVSAFVPWFTQIKDHEE